MPQKKKDKKPRTKVSAKAKASAKNVVYIDLRKTSKPRSAVTKKTAIPMSVSTPIYQTIMNPIQPSYAPVTQPVTAPVARSTGRTISDITPVPLGSMSVQTENVPTKSRTTQTPPLYVHIEDVYVPDTVRIKEEPVIAKPVYEPEERPRFSESQYKKDIEESQRDIAQFFAQATAPAPSTAKARRTDKQILIDEFMSQGMSEEEANRQLRIIGKKNYREEINRIKEMKKIEKQMKK